MPISPDSTHALQHTPGIIGTTASLAQELTEITKGAFSIGLIGWTVKRVFAHFTEKDKKAQEHNHERAGSIDKKEELLITTTADERKQILEMWRSMLEEQAKQRESSNEALKTIANFTEVIKDYTVQLKSHTDVASKISQLLELDKKEVLSDIAGAAKDGFTQWVDIIQKHPELAAKILAERNGPLNHVLESIAPLVDSVPLVPVPSVPSGTESEA